MRRALDGRASFSIALLVFAIVIFGATLTLGPTARLVPLRVVIPTVVLLAIQTVRDASGGARGRRRDVAPTRESEPTVLAWVLALPGLFYLLGLVGAAPVYVFAYSRWRVRSSTLQASLAAIVAWSLAVSVSLLLAASLPQGLVWSWLDR